MDLIQRPDELGFVSKVVSVAEYFEKALESYSAFAYDEKLPSISQLAESIGCNEEMVEELESVCGPANLKCGLEDPDDPFMSVDLQNTDLRTLNCIAESQQKEKLITSYRRMKGDSLKFRRTNFRIVEQFKEAAEADPRVFVNYTPPDVVLTIHLMRPFNRPPDAYELRHQRLMTLDSSFLVLGQTRLTELRDRIACLSDMAVNEDYSFNPDLRDKQSNILSHELYKSAFFYINGTFYNDFREPTCRDLSKTIRQWCQKSAASEMGPFQTGSMEETSFISLSLRLGLPYVYLHQGTCEHLLVFSDIRLLHPEDSQDPGDYPIQISSKIRKRIRCCICDENTAKWVTYNNTRLPWHPAFFCDSCYHGFNYDKNGQKLCDFEAVPHFDRQGLS